MSASVSNSVSSSASNTLSPSVTPSSTRTLTTTSSAQPSVNTSASVTPSYSRTSTYSTSSSVTPSYSVSSTLSVTRSKSVSSSLSASPSWTPSSSSTVSSSPSVTSSAAVTPGSSVTPSVSGTSSYSTSGTYSASSSFSMSPSSSSSVSVTSSDSASSTSSASASAVPASATASRSFSASLTPSSSASLPLFAARTNGNLQIYPTGTSRAVFSDAMVSFYGSYTSGTGTIQTSYSCTSGSLTGSVAPFALGNLPALYSQNLTTVGVTAPFRDSCSFQFTLLNDGGMAIASATKSIDVRTTSSRRLNDAALPVDESLVSATASATQSPAPALLLSKEPGLVSGAQAQASSSVLFSTVFNQENASSVQSGFVDAMLSTGISQLAKQAAGNIAPNSERLRFCADKSGLVLNALRHSLTEHGFGRKAIAQAVSNTAVSISVSFLIAYCLPEGYLKLQDAEKFKQILSSILEGTLSKLPEILSGGLLFGGGLVLAQLATQLLIKKLAPESQMASLLGNVVSALAIPLYIQSASGVAASELFKLAARTASYSIGSTLGAGLVSCVVQAGASIKQAIGGHADAPGVRAQHLHLQEGGAIAVVV